MNFGAYLRAFRGHLGALLGVAVVAATLLKFSGLVPPWPDENGVAATALAVVCCVVGISIGFYLPVAASARRWIGLGGLAIVPVLLIAYLYCHSTRVAVFAQMVDGTEIVRRMVVGKQTRVPGEESLSVTELVERHGLSGEAWTPSSLATSRLLLTGLYGSFYLALTFGLGLLQDPTTARPRTAARRAAPNSVEKPFKDGA